MSKYTEAFIKSAYYARSVFFDRRPTVPYVGGWHGKHNLGDNALFSAFRELFSEVSLVPFDGGRFSKQAMRILPNTQIGVLGGGTLIAHKRRWLEISRAFLDSGSGLIVFGTGVEDPSFWPGEARVEEWIPLLKRSGFVGVRGPISAHHLAGAGLKNVQVVGDPVLAFAYHDINTTPISGSIGLNVGVSDGHVWGSERRICDEIARLASQAKKSGWRVEWFVVWPKDLEITRRAAEASGTTQYIHRIYDDHQGYLALVRRLTAFVGMKLHATALATCALTPSVMLEYRPKCRDYMQSIGQDRFTFRTDTFRADGVWEIVNTWNAGRADAARTLARAVRSAQDMQRQLAARVRDLLRGNR